MKQWEAANTPIGLHIDVEAGLFLLIRKNTVGKCIKSQILLFRILNYLVRFVQKESPT